MPGTYPVYSANTQDTKYDIPGRTDIANAADYNDHDREILTHQSVLINHENRIAVVEGKTDVVIGQEYAFYFGEKVNGVYPEGTWRITREDNNLVRQRLESGLWITKGGDIP